MPKSRAVVGYRFLVDNALLMEDFSRRNGNLKPVITTNNLPHFFSEQLTGHHSCLVVGLWLIISCERTGDALHTRRRLRQEERLGKPCPLARGCGIVIAERRDLLRKTLAKTSDRHITKAA